MKIEKYKAFDANNVLRYVGIGNPGRHRHVNSENSHSDVLNACVAVAGKFRIEVEYENGLDALDAAKAWEKQLIFEHGRLHLNTGTLLNRSQGGEETPSCFDTVWYSSPNGKISKRFKDETQIPEGWIRGRLNMVGKSGWNGILGSAPPVRRGWKSWHNPSTGEILQLAPNQDVPLGFKRGTGKNTIGNKVWCIDPQSGSVRRFEKDKIPPNYRKGRK